MGVGSDLVGGPSRGPVGEGSFLDESGVGQFAGQDGAVPLGQAEPAGELGAGELVPAAVHGAQHAGQVVEPELGAGRGRVHAAHCGSHPFLIMLSP